MTRPHLILLACLLAAPALSRAEVPPDGAARQAAAATEVDALIQDGKARQTLPRLADPRNGPVLRRLWDTTTLGKPPYTAADLRTLTVSIDRQTRVLEAYSHYVPPPGTPPIPGGNDARFADEMCQAAAFTLANATALLEAAYNVWQKSPGETRAGPLAKLLPDVQRAVDLLVSAILDSLSSPGLTPANAAVLNQALERQGKAVAASMTLANRAKLQQKAAAVARKAPAEARTGLATLMAALDSPTCEGFCAMK